MSMLANLVKDLRRDPWSLLRAFSHPRQSLRRFRWRTVGDGPVEVALRDVEARVRLDPSDQGLSRDLYVHRAREEHATRFFQELLRPGQVVFDVGANLGYYVLVEAASIGPEGRILAIEPGPANFALLNDNIRLNGLEMVVEAIHGAVGDIDGTATLHLANRSNLHTLRRTDSMDSYVRFEETVEVPLMRLDAVAERLELIPDVIRMDIEGFEVAALAGMESLVRRARELIWFVEIHPKLIREAQGDQGYSEFLTRIGDLGFRPRGAAHSHSSRVDVAMDIASLDELEGLEEAVELFLVKEP